MNFIEAKNINLARDNHRILQDVSLQIQQNDFLTIIGPNGAGKSSLLRCLIGSQTVSDGQIIRHPALRIGYLPQDFFIDTIIPLTVNTFLHLARQKPSAQEPLPPPLSNLTDAEILSLTKIDKLLNRPLSNLSGGQRQRVLLTRALLLRPHLVILDEPAKNLDLSSQMELYKLLDNLYEHYQIAILMVSHDLHLVMSRSREVICLSTHICCSGKPQAIKQNRAFYELFGEDIAKQLSVYHHDLKHHHHHHDNPL